MSRRSLYPIHQGYLAKAPRDDGWCNRMKGWRKRWFVLKEDKSLEYYEERAGKLIKTINLNLCTSLDTKLPHKKLDNVFSIKLNGKSDDGKQVNREYFLAADTPYEMDEWVDQISKLCDIIGHSEIARSEEEKDIINKTTTDNDECCPLSNTETTIVKRQDSGINVPLNEDNNTDDVVLISPPVPQRQRSNDVPPSHPQSTYDVPLSGPQSTYDVPPTLPQRQRSNDVPPSEPQSTYDVPLSEPQSTYDVPPTLPQRQISNDVPPIEPQSTYDVPRSEPQSTYDVPPTLPQRQRSNDVPPIEPQSTYDVPPSEPSTYDIPPTFPQRQRSNDYDHQSTYSVPPTYSGTPRPSNSLKSGIYNDVPAPVAKYKAQSVYDIVPAPRHVSKNNNYDYVPQHKQFTKLEVTEHVYSPRDQSDLVLSTVPPIPPKYGDDKAVLPVKMI